jgi:hypothetical protein
MACSRVLMVSIGYSAAAGAAAAAAVAAGDTSEYQGLASA